MIYLIGGAPRVGKSRLVDYLVSKHPMYADSTDAIRSMLQESIPHDALDPDIFIRFRTDVLPAWQSGDYDGALVIQNRQSRAYWDALEDMIVSYDEDGSDVVVEGVAILPKFAHRLTVPNKAVFLGNTADSHIEMVESQARTNSHDWMHEYSDKELSDSVAFFAYMSRYIKDEATRLGYPYVEIHDAAFDMDHEIAAQQLLG